MRMEQAGEATRSRPSSRRSTWLRFAAALGLLGVALAAALVQPLRPEPLRAPTAWEWFLYPGETNAFLRAPVVYGELADVAQVEGSGELWVVGAGGIVLRSANRGATWTRVLLPDVVAAPAPGASEPQARWRLPDLIGTAHAGEPEAKPPDVATPPGDPVPGALDPNPYDRPEQGTLNGRQPPPIDTVANAPAPQADEQRQVPRVPPPPPEPPPPAPHETDLRLVRFVRSAGWILSAAGHVWRSSDRGQTWNLVVDADAGPKRAREMSFESANPDHAWVVTERGVVETTDGGASWRPLASKEAPTDVSDVALLDARRARIVARNHVFETTDGGASWRDLTDPKLHQAVSALAEDGSALAFIAELGVMSLGPDPGSSWKRTGWTTDDPKLQYAVPIAFSAERACVFDEGGSARCTDDGGERWEPHELATLYAPGRLRAQRDGTLFTLEGGNLWRAEPGAATSRQLLASAFPTEPAILALDRTHVFWLAGSVLRSSRDGGKSFAWLAEVGGSASSIAFRDAQHGYVASHYDSTLLSEDGGRTWRATTARGFGQELSCRGAICLTLESGRVARSIAGGPWIDTLVWSEAGPAQGAITLIAQPRGADPVAWALRADGTFRHSDDDGQSWGDALFPAPVADATGAPARIRSLALVDRSRAFAGGARLWTTSDGGRSWDVVPTGNESGVVSVSFADRELGFVLAGDGSLLRTQDGGKTWMPLGHARTPAPWLVLALSAFLLLLVPWPWEARAPRVETTIADVLASDRPLRSGDLDALRFGVVADGLADFLKNSRTEPPLTLAITGEWGSGKSSLMNLLKERLEAAGYRPVMFNAWHHQKGEHLFASLYANIREQAIPPWHRIEGLRYRAQLVTERVLERKLLSVLVVAGIATFVAWTWQDWSRPGLLLRNVIEPLLSGPAQRPDDFLIALMKALGMVTAPGVLVPVFRALRAFGVDPARLRNSSSESGGPDRVEPGARFRFAREFEQFTRSLRPRTLVVFIDDLDRCSKEHVVEVLEAVNFLVVSGRCFIVIGMAEEWVERCVELAFDDLAATAADDAEGDPRRTFARKYLEKLINIRVPIRKPTEAESRALLATMSSQNESRARPDPRENARRILGRCAPLAAALAVAAGGWWFGGYFLLGPGQVQFAAPPPEARGQLVFSEGAGNGGESVELSFPVHAPKTGESTSGLPHVVGEIPFGELKAQLVLEEGARGKADGDEKQRLLGPFPVAGGTRSLSVVIPALVAAAVPAQSSEARPDAIPSELLRTHASVWIGEPDAGVGLLWILPLALGLWITSLVFHALRREPAVVYDSDEFARALDAWVPWILAKRDTPRALKRFINHVRYVAMRERAESRSADPEAKLDEQQIVGLASLYHFDRRLVTDDEAFRAACGGRIDAALERLRAQGAPAGELASAADAFNGRQAPTILSPYRDRFLAIMADLVPTARGAPPVETKPS